MAQELWITSSVSAGLMGFVWAKTMLEVSSASLPVSPWGVALICAVVVGILWMFSPFRIELCFMDSDGRKAGTGGFDVLSKKTNFDL